MVAAFKRFSGVAEFGASYVCAEQSASLFSVKFSKFKRSVRRFKLVKFKDSARLSKFDESKNSAEPAETNFASLPILTASFAFIGLCKFAKGLVFVKFDDLKPSAFPAFFAKSGRFLFTVLIWFINFMSKGCSELAHFSALVSYANEAGDISPNSRVSEFLAERSEERRVGKECRSRWSPYH